MEIIIASNKKLKEVYAKAIQQGLELSSGARGSSTYYHSKDEQIKAIQSKVKELYKIDKSIPLLLASLKDSTLFFRQEVIRNELASGSWGGTQAIVAPKIWFDQGMQDRILDHVLSSLPPTYALRLFTSFADKKGRVNNSRTRDKIRSWVFANLNDFTAVKYRTKFRKALVHAYGVKHSSVIISNLERYIRNEPHKVDLLNDEVFRYSELDGTTLAKLLLFVFRKGVSSWYTNFKFTAAFFDAAEAKTEDDFFTNAKLLDVSVAIGLIRTYPNPLFKTFKSDGRIRDGVKSKLLTTSRTLSDNQKVRTKALQEKVGGKSRKDVDYSKVQTETLYKTDGVKDQQIKRVKEDRLSLPFQHIGIVHDVSLSNVGGVGSAEAINSHVVNVLKESVQNNCVIESPKFQTDLTLPFVEIVKQHPDVEAIFIVSDGYENYPYEGCLNDMVKRYRQKGGTAQIIHCSPYVSAEQKAQARSLGSEIISLAVNHPSQIQTQMEARLLDFNPKRYFEQQFSKYLSPVKPILAYTEEEEML